MYYYITLSRSALVYNQIPELWTILGAVGYAFLFLLFGIIIFNKLKPKFAELI